MTPDKTHIPPRSVLLPIRPIGSGTANVESMSSYFRRLAQFNGFRAGQLLYRRIPTRTGPRRNWVTGESPPGLSDASCGKWEATRLGAKIASGLARMTGNTEPLSLCWFPAFRGMCLSRVHSETIKWCPLCLRRDRIPYVRASWSFRGVTHCANHNVRLLEHCAECGASIRHFHSFWAHLVCPKCGLPLSDSGPPPAQAARREITLARIVGRIAAIATSGTSALSGNLAVQTLLRWADQQGATSLKSRARVLGINKSTLSYWINGRSNPALDRIIAVSVRAQLDPCAVLQGRLRRLEQRIDEVTSAWPRIRHSTIGRNRALGALTSALRDNHCPHLASVARSIQVSRRSLRHWFPDLCEMLISRRRSHQEAQRRKRWSRFVTEIDSLIRKEVSAGRRPVYARIQRAFANRGEFCSPACRSHLRTKIDEAVRIHLAKVC